MKENSCKIEDCFCKCETKQELRDWTFRAIQKQVDKERLKSTEDADYKMFFLQTMELIDGYAELSVDMDD